MRGYIDPRRMREIVADKIYKDYWADQEFKLDEDNVHIKTKDICALGGGDGYAIQFNILINGKTVETVDCSKFFEAGKYAYLNDIDHSYYLSIKELKASIKRQVLSGVIKVYTD